MGERIQLRRRLRQQRQAREAMLLDLGALVYELHRQGRRAPELLQQKAAELEVVDGEVRELEDTLAGLAPEDAVPAYHEDFDELDDEEPEEQELEGDEGEFDEDELADDDLADDELDGDGLADDELDRDGLADDELDGDGLADDDFEDDDSYDDDTPADPDATVEVDALDGPPDDREARS